MNERRDQACLSQEQRAGLESRRALLQEMHDKQQGVADPVKAVLAQSIPGPRGLKILFANDSFCTMTGYSAAELVGRPHGVLHDERTDLERLRHWLPKAQPGLPLTGEGFLLRANGSTVSAASASPPP